MINFFLSSSANNEKGDDDDNNGHLFVLGVGNSAAKIIRDTNGEPKALLSIGNQLEIESSE